MSHTPGPWRAQCDEEGFWQVISDDGLICDISQWSDHTDAADAHLIAAAPALLAAIKELLKWWDEDDMDHEVYDEAERYARAAVKSAQREV